MPIVFDSSTAPVHIVTYRGSFSDQDWLQHIDGFRQLLGQEKPYAVVIDNTKTTQSPNAAQRHAMTDWLRSDAPVLRQFCRAVAFVHLSPLVRGAVTAIHWVAPPPYPFQTFAGKADAVEWAQKKLAG